MLQDAGWACLNVDPSAARGNEYALSEDSPTSPNSAHMQRLCLTRTQQRDSHVISRSGSGEGEGEEERTGPITADRRNGSLARQNADRLRGKEEIYLTPGTVAGALETFALQFNKNQFIEVSSTDELLFVCDSTTLFLFPLFQSL